MEPETEFRPGRLLLAAPLAASGRWPGSCRCRSSRGRGRGAAGRADDVGCGRDLAGHGREPRPQRTPLAELSPLSETGASCACANAGAATPAVRMAAEAAPRANSPVIHEALHFDVVIAESMTRLGKSTVKLTAGHSAGTRRLRAGRGDRPAPPKWLCSHDRRRKPDKKEIPQSIRHLFTIAPFQLGVWKSTGPRFAAFGEPNLSELCACRRLDPDRVEQPLVGGQVNAIPLVRLARRPGPGGPGPGAARGQGQGVPEPVRPGPAE